MYRIYQVDPELATALEGELARQNNTIELIASENFTPEVILQAQGSILTNKYAEGYPGRRYHGGCQYIDTIETLAMERAKRLFSAEYANVQPHSGVNANLAVMVAVLEPGDTILGMDLKQGGHLSHGAKASITGRYYRSFSYGLHAETEILDMDQVRTIARRERPKMIIAGASAYSRVIDFAVFRDIADEVGAYLLTDIAHIAGLVAGGVHPSPVPYADFVTFTTTKTMRGARGGMILAKAQYGPAIDRAIFPGIQGGPIPQAIAGKALCFLLAMTEEFKQYARQIVANAGVLCTRLQEHGFRIVSGGTDTHLMLVDLRTTRLTGLVAEELLESVGITVNKNLIPGDPEKPAVTSGIRLGVAAMTSRGFKEKEMEATADVIAAVLNNPGDKAVRAGAAKTARELCGRFPLYLNTLELATSAFAPL